MIIEGGGCMRRYWAGAGAGEGGPGAVFISSIAEVVCVTVDPRIAINAGEGALDRRKEEGGISVRYGRGRGWW